VSSTCAGSSSLLADCGFELPVVAAGAYGDISMGGTIASWTVVGAAGDVDLVSTTFAQNGFLFASQEGVQSLDLTGLSNTATGVAQTVATTVGTAYDLSFWVGNLVDSTGLFGSTSTVDVLIDGAMVLAALNADGAGSTTMTWKKFTVPFTATSASTKVEFLNGDPASDNANFLDDVVLTAASSP
jgi:hypothetical protein